jgi:hypothetical protein
MMRIVRFLPNDEARMYEPVEFTGRDPSASCDMYYRRCETFGGVVTESVSADGICDLLDVNGDIVGDFYLNKKGLKYLYSALDTRVELWDRNKFVPTLHPACQRKGATISTPSAWDLKPRCLFPASVAQGCVAD